MLEFFIQILITGISLLHSDTVFYLNIHLLTHSPLEIVLKKLFEAS